MPSKNFTNATQVNDGLVDTDIGTTIQPYDATLLNDADIGVNVQPYNANTVITDATQTLTNKTIKTVSSQETHIALSGTAPSVNCSASNNFSLTLSGATVISFTNVPSSGTSYGMTIKVGQDAGGSSFPLTWPASVDWPGGIAPTLTATANAVDVFVFSTNDAGTTWYGFVAGQDIKTPA